MSKATCNIIKIATLCVEVQKGTPATAENMQKLIDYGQRHGVAAVHTTIEGVPMVIQTCSTGEASMLTFGKKALEQRDIPSAYPYGRDED